MKGSTHSGKRVAGKTGFAISILAGGNSSRMGHDKSRLRLRGRPLLGHVRAAANELGCQVRIIRRDLVSQCGPLGGIFTALQTSRAGAELFLACDMPFVSPALLRRVARSLGPRYEGVFIVANGIPGFPFALRTTALPLVEEQIHKGKFSISALARALKARIIPVPHGRETELVNINTLLDWQALQLMTHGTFPRGASGDSASTRPWC